MKAAPLRILWVLMIQGGIVASLPAQELLNCNDEFERCVDDSLYFCVRGSLEAGGEIDLVAQIDVETPGITSWTFGIRHDPEFLELIEATEDGLYLPPLFFSGTGPAEDPIGPGFASYRILSLFLSPNTLPVRQGTVLARARYRVLKDITPESSTWLTFSDEMQLDGVGQIWDTSFTVQEEVEVDGEIKLGIEKARPKFHYNLELGHDPLPQCSGPSSELEARWGLFSRGDVNGDTSVDLSDAVVLVQNIFEGKNFIFDCDDARDVNDDGALDTTDIVVLLAWKFLGGSRPAQPVLSCQLDGTRDGTPLT